MDSLIDYTDWEREKWHAFLRQHGADVLKIRAGPNSGSRFTSVGDLIRHIFSAEKRYIERLSGRSLTDTAAIPSDDIEAVFRLSEASRKDLKEFIAAFPQERWDIPEEQELGNSVLTVTPRKIIAHILLHEIRHWAQVATFFRMQGLTDGFHDFLFSPAMGGAIRKKQADVSLR
jgi:uncharacterized damage-inducible protein DinB